MLLYSSNFSGAMEAETISKNGASSKSQMSRGNILRKVLLSAVCIIAFTCTCFAQDIIVTKDAKRINAKVTEVNEDNVKYKNFDNLEGPTYTLSKGNIASILYQNGQVETFETAAVAPAPVTAESSGIEALNAKELEQIFAEALKLVSNFEEVSAEFGVVEGMNEFFYQWLGSDEAKKERVGTGYFQTMWYYSKNAEQKFIELTGLTYADLNQLYVERMKVGAFFANAYNFYTRLDNKNTLKKFLDTFKNLEDLRAAFELSLTEIEQSEVMTIPEYYRCSFALETMQRFVKNRRASTWKECVNLYEEQLHRWRMEMNSEESLRVQNDIRNYSRATARNTRATAIFSGLIWLGL